MSIPPQWQLPATFSDIGQAGQDDCAIVLRDCLTANYTRLYHRLLRHLGCPDRASDCLHDAWLKLGCMSVSAVISNPEAYVYRVACNIAIDRLRSGKPWQYVGEADVQFDTLVDESPGPDVIAEARSELAALDGILQCLPLREKRILFELKVEEKSREEVASYHGISVRNVDRILRQSLDYCIGRAKGDSRCD